MRHPGVKGERRVPGFVQTHDLLPTVMGLLGMPCGRVDGEDVWPMVRGDAEKVRDHAVIGWAAFSVGNATGRASVRDDAWNYMVSLDDPEQQEELFDLAADPEERSNVVSRHPDVVARQRARLEAVIGQPLPAVFPEVCDQPAPGPGARYLQARRRLGG